MSGDICVVSIGFNAKPGEIQHLLIASPPTRRESVCVGMVGVHVVKLGVDRLKDPVFLGPVRRLPRLGDSDHFARGIGVLWGQLPGSKVMILCDLEVLSESIEAFFSDLGRPARASLAPGEFIEVKASGHVRDPGGNPPVAPARSEQVPLMFQG